MGPGRPVSPCRTTPSSPLAPFSPLLPLTPLFPLGPCGPSGPGSPFTPCCPTTVKVALPLVGVRQLLMSTSSSCCGSAVTREEEEMMKETRSRARRNFIVLAKSDAHKSLRTYCTGSGREMSNSCPNMVIKILCQQVSEFKTTLVTQSVGVSFDVVRCVYHQDIILNIHAAAKPLLPGV